MKHGILCKIILYVENVILLKCSSAIGNYECNVQTKTVEKLFKQIVFVATIKTERIYLLVCMGNADRDRINLKIPKRMEHLNNDIVNVIIALHFKSTNI